VFYKVKVSRENNPPKTVIASGSNAQQAIKAVASGLRSEGITDAKGIEIIGQISSLRG
jgi:hypothetical protein